MTQGSVAGGVYFVRSGDFIKIGVASNVVRRVRMAAECWNPHGIEPLGWIHIPDDEEAYFTERSLHRQFEALRHRGEWYRAEPPLLEYIARHAAPWPYNRGGRS